MRDFVFTSSYVSCYQSIREDKSAVLEVTEPEETSDPKPEEPPLEAEKTEDGQTDITEAPPSTEEPGAKSKSPAPPTTPKPVCIK